MADLYAGSGVADHGPGLARRRAVLGALGRAGTSLQVEWSGTASFVASVRLGDGRSRGGRGGEAVGGAGAWRLHAREDMLVWRQRGRARRTGCRMGRTMKEKRRVQGKGPDGTRSRQIRRRRDKQARAGAASFQQPQTAKAVAMDK